MKRLFLIGAPTVLIAVILGGYWFVQEHGMRNPIQVSVVTEHGAVAQDALAVSWELGEEVRKLAPEADTWVILELYTESGEYVTSVGDGFRMSASPVTLDLSQYREWGRFHDYPLTQKYKVRASLRYDPQAYECDPEVTGECVPTYFATEADRIEQLASFVADSEPFTIAFPNEVSGTPDPDAPSELADLSLKYGFSVTYPEGWNVTAKEIDGDILQVCMNPPGTWGDCTGMLTVTSESTGYEARENIRRTFAAYRIDEQSVIVDDAVGMLYQISGFEPGQEGFTRVLVIESAGMTYTVASVHGYEGTFDALVSSLSFTHEPT